MPLTLSCSGARAVDAAAAAAAAAAAEGTKKREPLLTKERPALPLPAHCNPYTCSLLLASYLDAQTHDNVQTRSLI